MVHVRISCHADLQALQDRFDETMLIKLVSLESLRIASDSYALIRNLIERRYWRCPQMDLLSLVASVALELHKIKHDLFPLLVAHEATLGEGFPKALLLVKNSGIALELLGKEVKEIVKKCVGSPVEVEVLLGKVEAVGGVLEDSADEPVRGDLGKISYPNFEDDDGFINSHNEKSEETATCLEDDDGFINSHNEKSEETATCLEDDDGFINLYVIC